MSDEATPAKRDWRDTVFLPKTAFPMKAGLPQKEPAILARWKDADLYGQLRQARAGREKFILHDGPPYANGDIHLGHAVNKILKDMVVKSRTIAGFDAPYVPGWDCHGMPIEIQIEKLHGKNLPTASSERVRVLLEEIDGQDAVLIESTDASEPSRPAAAHEVSS